jgi:lyso-ornithine lipid O-acyltransferase
MASLSSARAERTHPRAWLRLGGLALWLAICLPLHGLWRLFRAFSPWPRLFLRGAGWCAGMRVELQGERLLCNVLYIANHLSWLDILTLAGRTGSAFVAKADMAPWPVIGWLTTLNNSIFVQREARLDVGAQAIALGEALRTGQPLTLFPEGTTGDGVTLLPFRSSLLAAVSPPPEGVEIQPVVIEYVGAAADIAWTGDESVGHNALRVLSRPGTTRVVLHFLTPLVHSDFPDRKAITAHSRAAIAAKLGPDPRHTASSRRLLE